MKFKLFILVIALLATSYGFSFLPDNHDSSLLGANVASTNTHPSILKVREYFKECAGAVPNETRVGNWAGYFNKNGEEKTKEGICTSPAAIRYGTIFVTELYNRCLDRDPESDEAIRYHWDKITRNGATRTTVENSVCESPAAKALRSEITDTSEPFNKSEGNRINFRKDQNYDWGNTNYFISSETFFSAKNYWKVINNKREYVTTDTWINATNGHLMFNGGEQYNWEQHYGYEFLIDEDGGENQWFWLPERTISLKNSSLWISESEQYVFDDSTMWAQETVMGQIIEKEMDNDDTYEPQVPDEFVPPVKPPTVPNADSPIVGGSAPEPISPPQQHPLVNIPPAQCLLLKQNTSGDMTIGSQGDNVKALQAYLTEGGYLIVPAGTDLGYFGALTQSALASYQRAVGISPAEGYFGSVTRSSINCSTNIVIEDDDNDYIVYDSCYPDDSEDPESLTCALLFSPDLSKGDESMNVVDLQVFLYGLGYLDILVYGPPEEETILGYFGDSTQSALASYQAAVGISPANGLFGQKTRDYLYQRSLNNQ